MRERARAYEIDQSAGALEIACELLVEVGEELLQGRAEQLLHRRSDVRADLCAYADPIRMLDQFQTTRPRSAQHISNFTVYCLHCTAL